MENADTLVADRLATPPLSSMADGDSDQQSRPFVGRWNHLVSTTNWEKGRIISEWRQALIELDQPAREYADETWARLVGAVTGGHVGRLRRVYGRFGATHDEYPGLSWSHFHSALDWDDAEMWLEGAVLSKWTVSQMRHRRWTATGALASERPLDEQIVIAELDEDVAAVADEERDSRAVADRSSEVHDGPILEGPDFGDADDATAYARSDEPEDEADEPVSAVRPFANLAPLPDDMAEAFEALKLAILRHKTADWRDISLDDVLAALDALKDLARAPSID